MMFNSFMFLVFFAIIIIMLFIVPKTLRKHVLLAASIFFYGVWEFKYVLILLLLYHLPALHQLFFRMLVK